MNRNVQIDVMKGFAILLVVLGHAIQIQVPDFNNNIYFRIIYSFHMPLFMFLSGYTARPGGIVTLKKHFIRLVLPFVCWYHVWYLITPHESTIYYEYIFRWIKSPDWGLWFLWVLFLCHCALYASIAAEKYFGVWSTLIIYLIINKLPSSILGFGLLKWHFLFFVTGYIVCKKWSFVVRYKHIFIAMSIVFYPILVQFWYRTEDWVLLLQIQSYLKSFHIPGSNLLVLGYKYIVAILGIGFSYQLCKVAQSINIVNIILRWLGVRTLEIYAVHQGVLGYGFGQGTIKIVSDFIAATFLSLGAASILKKVPIIRTALYGNK